MRRPPRSFAKLTGAGLLCGLALAGCTSLGQFVAQQQDRLYP